MRSYVPAFRMETPRDLGQALTRMNSEPGVWAPFAGGTDIMVLLEAGHLRHRQWLNIADLRELKGIEVKADAIEIGAAVTYSEIMGHDVLRREFPSLSQAAAETGARAIQNRGTLGGNIANASPAADSPPALLAYGAQLRLVSARGERWLDYDAFHQGYKRTALAEDELIATIRLPRQRGLRHFYRKVGTRRAQAIAKVVLSATLRVENGKIVAPRLAIGSVGPTTLRCAATERVLNGQTPNEALVQAASQALQGEITPIDDVRSTAEFRATVAANVLRGFLQAL